MGDIRPLGTVQFPHVCPWCGSRYAARPELDAHWGESPQCFQNRFVSSQLKKPPPDPTELHLVDDVDEAHGLRLLDHEDADHSPRNDGA